MAYDIIWSPKARQELKDLEKELAKKIFLKTEELKFTPHHFVEKLTGTDCWRLRIGDYRVVINIDSKKNEIHIIKVSHRKNIYK